MLCEDGNFLIYPQVYTRCFRERKNLRNTWFNDFYFDETAHPPLLKYEFAQLNNNISKSPVDFKSLRNSGSIYKVSIIDLICISLPIPGFCSFGKHTR